jgi:hypothetical protein
LPGTSRRNGSLERSVDVIPLDTSYQLCHDLSNSDRKREKRRDQRKKAKKRDNEERRNNEKKINAAAMKRRRLDEAYRDQERQRNALAIRWLQAEADTQYN